MMPDVFEWRQDQLERAYEKGEIGKITFMREMSKLGFGADTCREFFEEVARWQSGGQAYGRGNR